MTTANNDGLIYWANGDTQNAILARDFEDAADTLGIDPGAVNSCEKGEMEAYGVAMKDDEFQAFAGLAR